MKILGLVFTGTATDRRPEMSAFVADVLGLERIEVEGVEADLFSLPDGSAFAVSDPWGMGDTTRTIGFLVADLDAAAQELRAAGVEVDDEEGVNERWRYLHFTAPDGQLYEICEEVTGRSGSR